MTKTPISIISEVVGSQKLAQQVVDALVAAGFVIAPRGDYVQRYQHVVLGSGPAGPATVVSWNDVKWFRDGGW